MQVPLHITVHDMPHSGALDARIRDKVAELEHFHPHITSCRNTAGEFGKRHHQGGQFEARTDVRVPGHTEIVSNRQHHEDVFVALRDALASTTRQLEEVIREKRGEVKAHEPLQQGTLTRISRDEGIGFIETSDGRQLYFSRENVVHPTFEHLKPGATVRFIEARAAEGMQAKRVSTGKHRAPLP
ncbi:MAG TPA: HPF/RaiA family ribosome-associated protein [Casimicrobiaceae bacterium]|nr:HPF/RaiA family ribosome-associated protein [Casimicrobiaceae bacterium]